MKDVELDVIQEIIKYCKVNKRESQKYVGDLFDVPSGHVKIIKNFIKHHSIDSDSSQSNLDTSSQATDTELKEEFASVAELTKYLLDDGNADCKADGADGADGTLEKEMALFDEMSMNGSTIENNEFCPQNDWLKVKKSSNMSNGSSVLQMMK